MNIVLVHLKDTTLTMNIFVAADYLENDIDFKVLAVAAEQDMLMEEEYY